MRDSRIVVSGGSGALGVPVVSTLASAGAHIVVAELKHRDRPAAWAAFGDRVELIQADLRRESEAARVVDAMESIEGLVCIAGGFAYAETVDTTVEVLREQFELNLVTVFTLIKQVLPKMLAADYGRIVTVGSRAAEEPTRGLGAYAAAKAGVIALTRAVAEETKGTGVTANCVLPSVIDTPANRRAMPDADVSKWVRPQRLAKTIAFLLSEAAGDTRGAAVRVVGSV